MSDNIERIHEEPLFRCSSIKKTDDDRKSGRYFNFDKRKKKDGKKEDNTNSLSYIKLICYTSFRG